MKYPKFLQKGDTIGITAPSDGNRKEMDYQRLDLCGKKDGESGVCDPRDKKCGQAMEEDEAAKKTERAEQLMSLITDPGVSYIFSAKGGDFLMEILPFGFSENPGKSDLVSGIFGQYRTYVYHYDIV